MTRVLSHTSSGVPVSLTLDAAGLTAAWDDDGPRTASLTFADARAFLDGEAATLALRFRRGSK